VPEDLQLAENSALAPLLEAEHTFKCRLPVRYPVYTLKIPILFIGKPNLSSLGCVQETRDYKGKERGLPTPEIGDVL
jgi:hypothetical protein